MAVIAEQFYQKRLKPTNVHFYQQILRILRTGHVINEEVLTPTKLLLTIKQTKALRHIKSKENLQNLNLTLKKREEEERRLGEFNAHRTH